LNKTVRLRIYIILKITIVGVDPSSHRDCTDDEVENQKQIVKSEENEEVFVIVPTNAVSYPRTMVIIPFHAIVALVAVRRPQRSENIAGFAIFESE
jgi:hypothetical protein